MSPQPHSVSTTHLETPLGTMVAGATDQGVCLLEFADRPMLPTQLKRVEARLGSKPTPGDHRYLRTLEEQLADYFAGERKDFDIPLVLAGTDFQERVWRCLLEVPYGRTISYDELARRAGSPGGSRAAGGANGDNRIAIVVPCHRVIRANGDLGGYGGGIRRKQRLLDLEAGEVQGVLF